MIPRLHGTCKVATKEIRQSIKTAKKRSCHSWYSWPVERITVDGAKLSALESHDTFLIPLSDGKPIKFSKNSKILRKQFNPSLILVSTSPNRSIFRIYSDEIGSKFTLSRNRIKNAYKYNNCELTCEGDGMTITIRSSKVSVYGDGQTNIPKDKRISYHKMNKRAMRNFYRSMKRTPEEIEKDSGETSEDEPEDEPKDDSKSKAQIFEKEKDDAARMGTPSPPPSQGEAGSRSTTPSVASDRDDTPKSSDSVPEVAPKEATTDDYCPNFGDWNKAELQQFYESLQESENLKRTSKSRSPSPTRSVSRAQTPRKLRSVLMTRKKPRLSSMPINRPRERDLDRLVKEYNLRSIKPTRKLKKYQESPCAGRTTAKAAPTKIADGSRKASSIPNRLSSYSKGCRLSGNKRHSFGLTAQRTLRQNHLPYSRARNTDYLKDNKPLVHRD